MTLEEVQAKVQLDNARAFYKVDEDSDGVEVWRQSDRLYYFEDGVLVYWYELVH